MYELPSSSTAIAWGELAETPKPRSKGRLRAADALTAVSPNTTATVQITLATASTRPKFLTLSLSLLT